LIGVGFVGSQLLGLGDALETQGGERIEWFTAAVAGGCQCDPGWREDGLAHSCWDWGDILWRHRVGND
jgi:hypothetical protein